MCNILSIVVFISMLNTLCFWIVIIIMLIVFCTCMRNLYIHLCIANFELKNNSRFLVITDIQARKSLWKKICTPLSGLDAYAIDINNCKQFQYWLAKAATDNVQRLDISVQTLGGDVMANDVIVSNIISFRGIVNVYIPMYAHSAGSMIALASTKLYLNNHSVMGPVDPIHSHGKDEYSMHSLIELLKIKKINNLEEDMIIKYIDGKKIYDDNIDTLRKIFTKKKYSYKKIQKIINEFGSGKYPHDKIFSADHVKSLGINPCMPVPYDIMKFTENILQIS